eukprot:m.227390 g.227390  ORF g.227390 m.227390 type:complete len:70 (+) comp13871_c0_seq3:85-294(+)
MYVLANGIHSHQEITRTTRICICNKRLHNPNNTARLLLQLLNKEFYSSAVTLYDLFVMMEAKLFAIVVL